MRAILTPGFLTLTRGLAVNGTQRLDCHSACCVFCCSTSAPAAIYTIPSPQWHGSPSRTPVPEPSRIRKEALFGSHMHSSLFVPQIWGGLFSGARPCTSLLLIAFLNSEGIHQKRNNRNRSLQHSEAIIILLVLSYYNGIIWQLGWLADLPILCQSQLDEWGWTRLLGLGRGRFFSIICADPLYKDTKQPVI